jgi:MSHA biogenesis protein MshP
MMPRSFFPQRLRRSAGVGLITAIFLLVVLTGLGVAMVTVFSGQQASSALDVQGARAYQAARAGIEWGLFQKLRNNTCASASFAMPAGTTLSGFVVTVTCQKTSEAQTGTGGPGALDRWLIQSVACNLQAVNGACTLATTSSSPDFVKRVMAVQI